MGRTVSRGIEYHLRGCRYSRSCFPIRQPLPIPVFGDPANESLTTDKGTYIQEESPFPTIQSTRNISFVDIRSI